MRQHTNAFDLIRLAAALAVIWTHQHVLMGLPGVSYGAEFGVCAFFAISGYLNTASLLRRRAVGPFLLSRALRIYPALIVCVLLTALLGALLAPGWTQGWELLAFTGKNVTLFTGAKLGISHVVFPSSALPEALNGSLWTLPYEVRFYVVLAIALAAFRFNNFAVAAVSLLAFLLLGLEPLSTFGRGFAFIFLAGTFIAATSNLYGLRAASLIVAFLAFLYWITHREHCAFMLILTAAAIYAGSLPVPRWLRPPLDISYAVYLYAFPVQQISTAVTNNLYVGLAFSIVVTVALAIASALLIERRATVQRTARLSASDALKANRHRSNVAIAKELEVGEAPDQARVPTQA